MTDLRFKRVMRLDTVQRHFRLARVMWERGIPGKGGYSVKLSFGLIPRFFGWHRGAQNDATVTFMGIRIHYCRSYGGRFA